MRLRTAIIALMVACSAIAQDVIDVHSHIITPEFLKALDQENRLLDEGFPLPSYDVEQHLLTEHFQRYKQGTLHMVKSLKLPTMQPLDTETMKLIFTKKRSL